MVRFLASTILFLLGNAIGLVAAALLVDGFSITGFGLFVSLLFFTAAQIILAPFILKLSIKYVPALRGGIALVTTFIVLWLTTVFTDGLTISSLTAWVVAPLIVWLFALLAGIVLPLFLFKKALGRVQNDKSTKTRDAPKIKLGD